MEVPDERMHVIRFGVFEVDRRARELRKQGRRVRLQEQPFQVLVCLLERSGDVVTRDELRQHLWPSSVFVDFDHGLNNAIARLREALGDSAGAPRFIETLPRLGYRFIYPLTDVPTSSPVTNQAALTNGESPTEPSRAAVPRSVLMVGLLVAVVVVPGLLIGLWPVRERVDESPASAVAVKEPSIAVLPFASLSSDPESEDFTDGLSQEIVTRLASIRGLKVQSRSSSFYFKGRTEPPGVIGRMLKVNHILEGSVRRSGAGLHITAQLIDAGDGSRLWSQTFDRDLTDIFEIQEDIAHGVADALHVKLGELDEQRLSKRGTQDAEAYRLYVIANTHLMGISVRQDLDTARKLFERAVVRDPQFSAAHAGLSRYYFHRAWTSLVDVDGGARLGLAAAERAVAFDPESSEAVQARANFGIWRYRFLGDFQAYTQAHTDYRRAIQLDPSNYAALFDYGRAVLWHDADLAQKLFDRVVELEPLARAPRGMASVALTIRGEQETARTRLQALDDPVFGGQGREAVFFAGFEQGLGNLDDTVDYTRQALTRGGVELPVWLWGLYMSLGARELADNSLNFGDTELARDLSEAATLLTAGAYDAAFESLDRHRDDFGESRVLDLPAARLALIAGQPMPALAILARRLPDLFSGVEPVSARNTMPALDLVATWQATGDQARARQLLERIANFLDGPAAPRLPMFTYQRARAHALAGEVEAALAALDRAYAAGFRTTWAVDLHPQPLLYIDPVEDDPAFSALRMNPQYEHWLARTKADNAAQLAQLAARDAAQLAVGDR